MPTILQRGVPLGVTACARSGSALSGASAPLAACPRYQSLSPAEHFMSMSLQIFSFVKPA
jgi:hypothetical protein